MRALLFHDHLSYKHDLKEPIPEEGEALIKVSLAGICATDLEIVRGYMGFKGILGHEFVGTVVDATTKSLVGRRVVGEINIGCASCNWCLSGRKEHCPSRRVLGIADKDGAFADYLTLPEQNLHTVPDHLEDEEAVFAEPVAAACAIVERYHIRPTYSVCVLGDGRLGLLTAQVLRLTGCSLTVIGRHEHKLSTLTPLGIETVEATHTEGLQRFDIVIDATGSQGGLDSALSLLKPEGTLIVKTTVAGGGTKIGLNRVVVEELRLGGSRCGPFAPSLRLLSSGLLNVMPLISNIFPIERGIEAFREAQKPDTVKVLLRMD